MHESGIEELLRTLRALPVAEREDWLRATQLDRDTEQRLRAALTQATDATGELR